MIFTAKSITSPNKKKPPSCEAQFLQKKRTPGGLNNFLQIIQKSYFTPVYYRPPPPLSREMFIFFDIGRCYMATQKALGIKKIVIPQIFHVVKSVVFAIITTLVV